MKQKLLKKSLLLFLSGIIIVSCTLEKDALEEHEHRKLTEQRISLYEIPGLQSKINARIQANKSMNRGGEIDYLELLNPDNVLLIEEENGNKHYTFSLNMQENNTLTNVVIKQVGTEIDYKVIEYASPDIEQWLIDNIDNGYSTITPTITQKGDGNDCLLFDASWNCRPRSPATELMTARLPAPCFSKNPPTKVASAMTDNALVSISRSVSSTDTSQDF